MVGKNLVVYSAASFEKMIRLTSRVDWGWASYTRGRLGHN